MKYIKKVDDSYSLKNLFNEHVAKFNLKHEQELVFLDDVRSFIEKKSQLELQYSQSLKKLCSQYMNKTQYQLNSETTSEILIPESWKLTLEQYAYIAEKKQVSSKSILMNCDYFKKMREQKQAINQIAVHYLKSIQTTLSETHLNSEHSYRSYLFDQVLLDQRDKKLKMNNANLEKKLNKKGLKMARFKKLDEELTQNAEKLAERKKKLDFAKLGYITSSFSENQQLQYYFSMELPELMRLQNANLDIFLEDSIKSIVLKDIEVSKFLVRQFDEAMNLSETYGSTVGANSTDTASQLSASSILSSQNTSENYFLSKESCFNNIIQFDLKLCDPDFDRNFEFTFQRDHLASLGQEYAKWHSKLSELEGLMSTMIEQINEKRSALKGADESSNSLPVVPTHQKDFIIDLNLEKQRFLISQKKMQMIMLNAKIDALGSFNINLKDLEEYNNATHFEEKKHEFQNELNQNLELWDNLMKSIDDLRFSDDSYDVEMVRKTSKDFSSSHSDTHSDNSVSMFDPKFWFSSKKKLSISVDPHVEPKFGIALTDFNSDNELYLSFNREQFLILFDEISNDDGYFYKAKTNTNRLGLVNVNNVIVIKDDPVFVKSVYKYEGLDEQEISFPAEVYIRLLRKNITNKKFDGEQWFEGAYNNKIGYFPSIFVEELFTPTRKFSTSNERCTTEKITLNEDIANEVKEEKEVNEETLVENTSYSTDHNESKVDETEGTELSPGFHKVPS